jgi:hypothetical protein
MSDTVASAQQWQPTRTSDIQSTDKAHELRQVPAGSVNGLRRVDHAPRPVLSSAEQVGTGVVLRWQTTAPRGASTATELSGSKIAVTANNPMANNPTQHTGNAAPVQQANFTTGFDNPLRQSTSRSLDDQVRPAAYQQEWTNPGRDQQPQWKSVNARRTQEEAGQSNTLPSFDGNLNQAAPTEASGQANGSNSISPQQPSPLGLQDPWPELKAPTGDPFDQAEAAPAPPLVNPEIKDPPSFPPQLKKDESPSDQAKEQIDPPSPMNNKGKASGQDQDDELEGLLRRARQATTPNCVSQRDLLRGKPLSSIDLDAAPKLSEGLSSLKDKTEDEEARKEFDKKSMLRDWTDYKGNLIVSGRLVDMRLGNIVLDVGGSQRLIPLSHLSDVDMSYIADLWNLPFRCGTGFEPLEGRNFIASTVQWKASGACHNPLYFQQVQLERYGHEVGPVLQPLISSAHFFLTIPMLPYKMGINPPNECQYSLGYHRPGNCAPYMIQPFPWSLRGGLAEAAAAVGAVAIIP